MSGNKINNYSKSRFQQQSIEKEAQLPNKSDWKIQSLIKIIQKLGTFIKNIGYSLQIHFYRKKSPKEIDEMKTKTVITHYHLKKNVEQKSDIKDQNDIEKEQVKEIEKKQLRNKELKEKIGENKETIIAENIKIKECKEIINKLNPERLKFITTEKELQDSNKIEDKKIKEYQTEVTSKRNEITSKEGQIEQKPLLLDQVKIYKAYTVKITNAKDDISKLSGFHLSRSKKQKKVDEGNIDSYKDLISILRAEMSLISDQVKNKFKNKLNSLELNKEQKKEIELREDQKGNYNLNDVQIQKLELTVEQINILANDEMIKSAKEIDTLNDEIQILKNEELKLNNLKKESEKIMEENKDQIKENNLKITKTNNKIHDEKTNIEVKNDLIKRLTEENLDLEKENPKLELENQELMNEYWKLKK